MDRGFDSSFILLDRRLFVYGSFAKFQKIRKTMKKYFFPIVVLVCCFCCVNLTFGQDESSKYRSKAVDALRTGPDENGRKTVKLYLDAQLARHQVTFVWVKGHSDNPYNNRCDELAVAQTKKHAL